MKTIWEYIRAYIAGLEKTAFFLTALFTGIAVFINYHWGLNEAILRQTVNVQFLCWAFVFLICFSSAYGIQAIINRRTYFKEKNFVFLILVAALLFAWKMAATYRFPFHSDAIQNNYWNRVSYWPFKVVVVTLLLWMTWRKTGKQGNFYGVQLKGFHAGPYWIMLLLMVPLVIAAATQPDFQRVYPKLQHVAFISSHPNATWYKLLYELAYGSDFFTIELFFRGFLVLAFARYAGKDAILSMAVFYCVIHFGKPLGECISSFFGGMILGIVVYHTRNIMGGLLVHVGIAWMMEAGGLLL